MSRNEPFVIDRLQVYSQVLSIVIESLDTTLALDSSWLRVDSFQGQEAVAQPYSLTVELRADDVAERTEQTRVLDSQVIGLWARLRIALPGSSPRWFRGIITELALGAPGSYTLTLHSPLQILSLRNRYHIYGDCTLKALLQQVFARELENPRFRLRFDFDSSPTLTREQDWMQAGETDQDFVTRVIGHAAVHYYFIHEEQQLTLVFSNSPTTSRTVTIPGHAQGPVPLRYTYTSIDELGAHQADVFSELRYVVKLMPARVRALLTRTEAEWESNAVAGFANHDREHSLVASSKAVTGFYHHKCYDYGTSDVESEVVLEKICQQIATEQGSLSGKTSCALLSPGYCFQLSDPLLDGSKAAGKVQGTGRPEFDGQVFVVTRIQHQMASSGAYNGTVEATQVSTAEDRFQQTFLTPFSIANTQQGSVLATVLQNDVPAGWRYRSKKNFQPETGQSRFADQPPYAEKGVLVRLATGQEHWVILPRSSTTVPEVGAMVMIGRGSNESEQPELQQVLASHGQKTIQPPDRRNASWLANTSWGSNYSTSYGDSISIHYGNSSPTDLDRAIRLVEGAYDNIGMDGSQYGSSSYSKGGGWSVQLSNNADVGVLGASISQGSSFSESHSNHSYGYSAVNLSENYSEVGKSASVSVIGEYTPAPDLDAPSFVNGKVPKDVAQYSAQLSVGDTFSKSTICNRSISSSGIGMPAPPVSIPAASPAGSYSVQAILGITQNASLQVGASFSESMMVGLQASASVNCSHRFSTGLTLGNSYSMETRIGNVSGIALTIGNNSNFSTNISDNTSVGINIGTNSNTQLNISDNVSTNLTLGSTSDTSAFIGSKSSVSAFIGATQDTSVNVSARESTSVMVGTSTDTSVNVSARQSTSINVAAVEETSINVSARNSTNISVGVSDELNVSVAARTATNIGLALTDETNLNIGVKNSTDISLSASVSTELSMAASMKMVTSMSASMLLQNSLSATAKIINQAGPEFEMINGVTKAEMDQRQQAKLRQTIIEIISGIDAKM